MNILNKIFSKKEARRAYGLDHADPLVLLKYKFPGIDDFIDTSLLPSGSYVREDRFTDIPAAVSIYGPTGTKIDPDLIDVDALWDRLYGKMIKVIITCDACGSANAISNAACIQCGIGLGSSIERSVDK